MPGDLNLFSSFDKRLWEKNMGRPGVGWSEPHRRWSPRRRPGATFVSPLASSPRRWLSRWAGAGLYQHDDVEEHKETRKSPCAAFQGEAAASHRGHCKKTTQVFSFVEKMKICVFFWWWSSHQNGESGQSMWRNFLWAFFHQVATIMAECHICRIYIVNIVTPIITSHYQIHFTLNKQPLSFIKIIVIGINTLWLCNCIVNKYHKGSFKEKQWQRKKKIGLK